MDIDGSILTFPNIPDQAYQFDIALNRLPWAANRWCVSSMLFNYTEKTKELLDRWITLTDKKIDHDAFVSALTEIDNLSIFELPHDYITFAKVRIPKNAQYIVHRVSTSDLKIQYKNRRR